MNDKVEPSEKMLELKGKATDVMLELATISHQYLVETYKCMGDNHGKEPNVIEMAEMARNAFEVMSQSMFIYVMEKHNVNWERELMVYMAETMKKVAEEQMKNKEEVSKVDNVITFPVNKTLQ